MQEVLRAGDETIVPGQVSIWCGSYFQPDIPSVCATYAAYLECQIGAAGNVTLGEYQNWTALNWMTPHGTHKTGMRLAGKLVEEHAETLEELARLSPRSEGENSGQDSTAAVEELGDAIWAVCASAKNCGVDLQSAVADRLGLRWPLTLSELHARLLEDNAWMPSWTDVDYDEVGTIFADTDELAPEILFVDSALRIRASVAGLFDHYKRTQTPPSPELLAAASNAHVDALLILCYMLHHWAYSDLSQAVAMNFAKLQTRLRTGTIDKAAGGRPDYGGQ